MSGASIMMAFTMLTGATFAAFSSTASNTGNIFASGTMTLEVNPFGGTTSTPTFNISNVKPGDSNEKVIILKNTGLVPSTTTILTSINHTGSSPDLGDKLTLEIWDDVDGSGTINPGDVLKGTAHITAVSWSNIDLGFGLAASGGTHQIIAKVTMDDADNTYQGTNSHFDLNFKTSQ